MNSEIPKNGRDQNPETRREPHWQIVENWIIPSTTTSQKSASSEFAELIKHVPNESDKIELQWGFDEAVTNAMLHGNKYDPHKNVEININISPESVTLTVRDEGEGFDPTKVPDPTSPERILETSGRGIFMMRAYFQVEYSDEGRKVTLTRKLNQDKPKDEAK